MLFGLDVSMTASRNADPVADARAAEALGYDFISVNDHLHGGAPRFETWTTLCWMAAETSRIRLATRVLGVPYRHPPVVTKMAETFDRLSRGRLILGLGGGASDKEFQAFGLGVRSPRDKVRGLEETIRIVRGLWSERRFSFDGRLYRTDGAEIEPKPKHPIPIWLGTYGPHALEVTGRLADGWIPSFDYAPPSRVTAMRERILSAARGAGRDPAEITCIYNMEIGLNVAPQPGVVTGTAGELVERLRSFNRLGFQGFNFIPIGPQGAEQLAGEVVARLRAG